MHKLILKASCGVSLRTVYNVKKIIDMGNGIQRKPGNGRFNKKRNRDLIDALKTKIAKNQTIHS